MENQDINKNEAEFAGYVDRGTQVVLQDAIKQIVETFTQTDALEDILSYLEDLRESSQNSDDRIKEVQQKGKQIGDKVGALETSTRNLLQRIQTMEVQVNKSIETIDALDDKLINIENQLARLTGFFEEKSGFGRLFAKLEMQE